MNLNEAEVLVSTKQEIENGTFTSHWQYLSDYGDMDEFYDACNKCFPDEDNPLLKYLGWENIPESLIREDWLYERIYDFKDACDQLDEEEIDYFFSWCKHHHYDIALDDPYQLVALYQANHSLSGMDENDESSVYDSLLSQGITNNLYDTERYSFALSHEYDYD